MDKNEFFEYCDHPEAFHASEIAYFHFMSDDELYDYQRELEFDTGNLSNWDHIRALYTLKMKLKRQ